MPGWNDLFNQIGKVKLFKQTEIKKLEDDKCLDPLTPELLFALSPIIENDLTEE